MSSYHPQYLIGQHQKDSPPDYLTCGFCSKEFRLENITLFIAHKSLCDITNNCNNKNLTQSFEGHDTSSPLTCSACSRVFMTARGLLRHVQQDHKMNICLQKGPLIIGSEPDHIQPPPAHTIISNQDFTTDKVIIPSSLTKKSSSTYPEDDHSDQPTDLSLSCSNSLGTAVLKCTQDQCKITIEPKEGGTQSVKNGGGKWNERLNNNTATLPKKRRFLAEKDCASMSPASDEGRTVNCASLSPGIGLRGGPFDTDDENTETEPENEGPKGQEGVLSVEYEQTGRFHISIKSENGTENEKDMAFDRQHQSRDFGDQSALKDNCDKEDCEKSNKMLVKFPFPLPKKREKSGVSVTEVNHSSQSTFNVDNDNSQKGVSSYNDTPTKLHRSRPSTLSTGVANFDQNIEQLPRRSVASDNYPDEFEILRMESSSNATAPKSIEEFLNPSSDSVNSAISSLPNSPRLMTPTIKRYRHTSLSSVADSDMPGLIVPDKAFAMYEAAQRTHHGAQDSVSQGMSRPLPSLIAAGLGVHDDHSVYGRSDEGKQRDLTGLYKPMSTSAFQSPDGGGKLDHISSSHQTRRRHYQTGLTSIAEAAGHLVDKSSFRKPFHTHGQGGVIPVSSVSMSSVNPSLHSPVLRDMTAMYRGLSEEQWLSTNSDCSSDYGVTSRSARRLEIMDLTSGHPDYDLVGMESGDNKEGKGLKKRRYPTSRPFKCAHCDQAFNQRIHLKKHMSKHTGVKPFKCGQCDYSTVERSHLKVHYRIHTGEKPYRCAFCDYATAQNSTLKIHLKRHHEGQQTLTEGNRGLENIRHREGSPYSQDSQSRGPSYSSTSNGFQEMLHPHGVDSTSSSPRSSSLSRHSAHPNFMNDNNSLKNGQMTDQVFINTDPAVTNGNYKKFLSQKTLSSSTSSSSGVETDLCSSISPSSSNSVDGSFEGLRSGSNHTDHQLDSSNGLRDTCKPDHGSSSVRIQDSVAPQEFSSSGSASGSPSRGTEESHSKGNNSPVTSGASVMNLSPKRKDSVAMAPKGGDPMMIFDQDDEEDMDNLDYSDSIPSVTIPDKAFVRG